VEIIFTKGILNTVGVNVLMYT
jgi:hypothetical protein